MISQSALIESKGTGLNDPYDNRDQTMYFFRPVQPILTCITRGSVKLVVTAVAYHYCRRYPNCLFL